MSSKSTVPTRPADPALPGDVAANENVLPLIDAERVERAGPAEPRFVGRGRGAEVYALDKPDGTILARKVFVGSGLARMVHQVFFGADNPYVWDRSAMAEAVCRRRVLEPLVSWWLKGKARIAKAHDSSWNSDLNVNELSMEFIDGRPALLRQPYSGESVDEVADLVTTVMRPLQTHLVEAGFDGAAWQAGLYNPVATSNFLRREKPDGTAEWVWIDAESGVPALFPANPLGLLKFYIPRSIKHGHPLFDDVDIGTLRRYLAAHESEIRADLGDDAWATLMADAEALDAASKDSQWKRMGRVERGIEARLTRKEIDDRQATRYRRHPFLWILRETGFGFATIVQSVKKRFKTWLHPKLWSKILVESVKLMLSDRYRMTFARNYVAHNIERWHKRKQLDATQFDALQTDLNDAASAVYLTDFGMHLAVKPLVKVLTWGVFPFLYSVGIVDPVFVGIFVVGGGAISRSIYTLYRILAAYFRRQSRPWVALGVGVLPVFGNIAFPIQLLFDGVRHGRGLSQFIVYDSMTRVGEFVPIWGGADTLTEHTANRVAYKAFALTSRRKA